MRIGSLIIVIFLFFAGLNIFGQSNSQSLAVSSNTAPSEVDKPPARSHYIGDEGCSPCHREKVESFHQTAHYLTSRLPDKNSILGKFTPGADTRTTSNPELFFRMDETQDGFFQTAVQGIAPYTTERTERFGLVIGSGGKGQTYLFWRGDQLFQLPVSYWKEIGWVNSPGYRDGVANFGRATIPRCLECHASYFEAVPPPPNRYSKTGFAVGITCEKCHGPGREHAQREGSQHPAPDSAIRNPERFSRDRKMNVCAWCHAGQGVSLASAFSYLPGEPLEKYLELPTPDAKAEVDVHGSQVELLKKSRCFQSSSMTCLTCHDVHSVQHDLATFSQHCLNCHSPGTAMFPKKDHQAASNCIDCHMPRQDTNLIVFEWNGKKVRPQVRSHWISIYPAAAGSK